MTNFPVEQHPKFPHWKAALQHLVHVKLAAKEGRAGQSEVQRAEAEYCDIADDPELLMPIKNGK